MLRSMREGVRGPAGKVLLALIIVPFVFIGGMELFTGGNNDSVLSVNGEGVGQSEYLEELYIVRNEVAARMGNNVNPDLLTDARLSPMVVERLTQRKLFQQIGVDGKMELPEAGVYQEIVKSPEFQEDGKFSEARYRQILATSSYTEKGLHLSVESILRANQLQNGLARSGFGIEQQAKIIRDVIGEQRVVNFIALNVASVRDGIEVGEEELQNYFEETKASHITEFLVDVEYLLLDKNSLPVSVSEEDLLEAYEIEKINFESVERRDVAHILLEISGEQPQEDGQQKLTDIKARIEAGEAFAELAKEYSQDPGSAGTGGALGYIEQDETFPPEFEQAAFALAVGEVSDVIKTDAGLHLLTVNKIEVGEIDSFEDRRDAIEQQLRQSAARKAYVEQLELLGEETFNAADLQGPANTLGLTLNTANGLSESGISEEGIDATIFSNRSVQEALFSSELLEEGLNSEPIEVSDSKAVVLRIASQHEPRQKTLDEVRELLVAELTNEIAKARVKEKAVSIKAGVNEQNSLTDIAAAQALDVQSELKLTRNMTDVSIDQGFRDWLFKQPRSSVGAQLNEYVANNGDVYLYQLTEVGSTDVEGLTDELLAQQSNTLSGQTVLAAFMANLKQNAEIVQNL